MTLLRAIPLLIFPAIAYVLCAITPLTGLKVGWLSLDGCIILFGIFTLLVEVAKASMIGTSVMIDHIGSLILLMCSLVCMVMFPLFQSETFVILFSLMIVDVMGGFVISQRVAQRDIGVTGGLL